MQVEDGCRSIMLMSIAAVQSHASATERAERQTLIERDHDWGRWEEWTQTHDGMRNIDTHGNSLRILVRFRETPCKVSSSRILSTSLKGSFIKSVFFPAPVSCMLTSYFHFRREYD